MLGINVYKNGVLMAVVQSYQSCKLNDGATYRLELLHSYPTLEAIKAGWYFDNDDGKGLDLVIEKQNSRIEYQRCKVADCRWLFDGGYWPKVYLYTVRRKEMRNE